MTHSKKFNLSLQFAQRHEVVYSKDYTGEQSSFCNGVVEVGPGFTLRRLKYRKTNQTKKTLSNID